MIGNTYHFLQKVTQGLAKLSSVNVVASFAWIPELQTGQLLYHVQHLAIRLAKISRIKKGSKCVLGCKCKNCGNSVSNVVSQVHSDTTWHGVL